MWRRTLPLIALLVSGCSDARSPAAPGVEPPLPATTLMRQVSGGGYVLFFRHAERDSSAMSTAALAVADNEGVCLPGSELTPKGIDDSLAIRQAFIGVRIRVDRVFASPTCRTTQMARLIFEEFTVTRALTWPDMWTEEEKSALDPGLRALLGAIPVARANTVLVSHNNVLQATRIGLDVSLGQGDAAVFRPLGGMRFELVGIIPLQDWLDARTRVGYNATR